MPGRSGTVGEIQRPLIFKLKSRYQLHEIVAQKMHISDVVYGFFDVDRVLGTAISVQGGATAAGAGTGFRSTTTVPVGKRWRVMAMDGIVTTAGGSAMVWNLAVSLLNGGSLASPAAVGVGASVAAGILTRSVAQMFDGLILEAGDQMGIIISTADATEKVTVTAAVFEEDFRENVV